MFFKKLHLPSPEWRGYILFMDPREAKSHLRAAIRDRLSHISDKERHAESRSLCKRIAEHLPAKPVTICGYYPLKDEIDLRPVLIPLIEQGWPVYLPRFEDGKLAFRKAAASSFDDLTPGPWGIPEPALTAEALDPLKLAIALVPARAYTLTGERLGRGNGGYDIWIRKQRSLNPKTKFWGVCLEAQIVQDIPMEEHDERVDAIVTAREFHGIV